MSIAEAYLDAAVSAALLLSDPAVARDWTRPSALPEFRVSGLAGHLAHQVLGAVDLLTGPPAPADVEVVALQEHYARATWIGAAVTDEVNVGVRVGGERRAEAGAAALAGQVRDAVEQLRPVLAGLPATQPVYLPWAGWALAAHDYLITRMMEVAVHSDDLACSVGVPPPPLPRRVMEPVFDLLVELAWRRHGATALLRALSRAERAPAHINAM